MAKMPSLSLVANNMTEDEAGNWHSIQPVPDDAGPLPPISHMKLYTYADQNRKIRCHVCRAEKDGASKNKKMLYLSYGTLNGKTGWHWKAPTGQRLPYRLENLPRNKEVPVLIVEGEKTADAAVKLFPDYAVLSSMGGSNAADRTDWNCLRGRNVVIWPDHDKPGLQYANKVTSLAYHANACQVRQVQPPLSLPKGWDLADPIPSGHDIKALMKAAVLWSRDYEMRPDGLYRLYKTGTGDDELPAEDRIAGYFRIEAQTTGPNGWGTRINFPNRAGQNISLNIPHREITGECRGIESLLKAHGLALGNRRADARHLALLLGRENLCERILIAKGRTGWNEDETGQPVFMLPDNSCFPASPNLFFETDGQEAANQTGSINNQQKSPALQPGFLLGNSHIIIKIHK